MKNYELANIIYENAKRILTAMDELNYEVATTANINDFLQIFSRMSEIARHIGIEPDYAKEVLEKSPEDIIKNQDCFSEFWEKYKEILKRFLIEVIEYRQYICVIKRNDSVPGLASHIITNIGQIVYALNQGYVPVIDTVNCDNCFNHLSKMENRNIWEKYFRQPFSSSLDHISESTNMISIDGIPSFYPSYKMDDLENEALLDFWRKVVAKYMRLSEYMEKKLADVKLSLGWNDKRVLGVICRGTDYTDIKPYNHPVQPDINKMISDAKGLMEEYHCDYCYLATEDETIYTHFKEVFGERLLFSQNILYSDLQGETLNSYNNQNEINADVKNEEYLISLKLLSECTCFIGGRTSGAVVATIFSKGFEHFHLYDEGRYGIDDLSTLNNFVV